jgi:REP element-mobilizing transposase RayT
VQFRALNFLQPLRNFLNQKIDYLNMTKIHQSFPIRRRPARERAETPKLSEYIFITCCTRKKIRVLDNHRTHQILITLWRDTTHWVVTDYVIMPDHIHLMVFASRNCATSLRSWTAWWKAQTTKELNFKAGKLWLPDIWDTRMRSQDHWADKLNYIRENPFRSGLVSQSALWPFQGNLSQIKPINIPQPTQDHLSNPGIPNR